MTRKKIAALVKIFVKVFLKHCLIKFYLQCYLFKCSFKKLGNFNSQSLWTKILCKCGYMVNLLINSVSVAKSTTDMFLHLNELLLHWTPFLYSNVFCLKLHEKYAFSIKFKRESVMLAFASDEKLLKLKNEMLISDIFH